MTDEEVLRIAQGLSEREWQNFRQKFRWSRHGSPKVDSDASLLAKGLLEVFDVGGLELVRFTPLGTRVWDWSTVFGDPND